MNLPTANRDDIDPAVIRAVAEGDREAFERVYDAFSAPLYALALRMLQRPEDAEELLQEIFARIWNEAARYNPERGAPLAWAVMMTRGRAIDRIRSTARRHDLPHAAESEDAARPAQPGSGPARAPEQGETARAVQDSLDLLPKDVRETIELAYFGGLSHSEIARKLSLPLTTVKSRVRRAMLQLRQTLRHLNA
ncbi:MAG TPA: sigma-70 family RNA polymerase sigma factor [Terrimicrobiaceae bacterium]|nr:sigma-70 family RNA polymerase sigma factor [Terrimicrobiaceae bacterium]